MNADMDPRDEIDELLADAGERWRAGLPPLAGLNSAFRRRAARDRRGVSLLGSAGALALVAMVVVVVLVALLTRPTDHPVAGPTPTPPPVQPWRLLATLHTSSNEAYRVRVATSDDEWQALWTAVDPAEAKPEADLSTQIVVSFGHGVGSTCPDLILDDVVIDAGAKRVYSAASLPHDSEPAAAPTPACTADLVGAVVFVVALDRAALPESPFTISLTSPRTCAGATCRAVKVDVAPLTEPAVLYLENRGGPAYTIRIGGRDIMTVGCGVYARLAPGEDSAPQLPWALTVVRTGLDDVIASKTITRLPQWFVQIGDGTPVGISTQPVAGPAGPTCPPEASHVLQVSAVVPERCGSVGGCVYSAMLSGPVGALGLTFEWLYGGTDLVINQGLPTTLAAGDYELTLISRIVTDEVANGAPIIGPVDATCSAQFTVNPNQPPLLARGEFRPAECSILVEPASV